MSHVAKTQRIALFVLSSLMFVAVAVAQTPAPKTISYQGYLTDFAGQPLNGSYTLAFQLHDIASGGTVLWSESHGNQNIVNGNFSITLGSQTVFPTSLDFGQQLWLQVEVTTPDGQTFSLSPRVVFQSTPYANFAHSLAADAVGTAQLNDSAVTTAKLSTDGASTDGQILTYDAAANNVQWRTPTGGGGGSLSLPFTGTASDNGTLFSVTNTGTGRAGFFEVNNPAGSFALAAQSNATTSPAIYGLNYGNGIAGSFVNSDPANAKETLRVATVGTGSAGKFEVSSATGPGTVLDVKTLGTGVAGQFTIDNTLSEETALRARTNGFGAAGFFDVTSSTNTNTAVGARTSGMGTAAAFSVKNTSNDSPVLRTSTNGLGAAADFAITNTANDSSVVVAQTVGLGRAGLFAIDHVQSVAPALEATTNGLGYAGLFRASRDSNVNTTLAVLNAGQGLGVRVQNDNVSNILPALIASTAGTGNSGYFAGGIGLLVETGTGSDVGGVTGRTDVVARFSSKEISTLPGSAAVSIEAGSNQNTSLFFAEDGEAMWELGHRSDDDDDFRLVYHGGTGMNMEAMDVDYSNGLFFHVNGWLLPKVDNRYRLGGTDYRWFAVYATNGVVQTSDRRLKSHITDLGYGLREVLALRPISYQWKDNPEQGTKLGLIAQEVEALVPEVVNRPDDEDGYLGMNYAELVPVLIQAIQEQQQLIDRQQKALGTLERQMALVLSGASQADK